MNNLTIKSNNMAAAKGAAPENGVGANPNEIEKFVDFSAPKVEVITAQKLSFYPEIGSKVTLSKEKAVQWVVKGWATTEDDEVNKLALAEKGEDDTSSKKVKAKPNA